MRVKWQTIISNHSLLLKFGAMAYETYSTEIRGECLITMLQPEDKNTQNEIMLHCLYRQL
jgi:hypothetical protein